MYDADRVNEIYFEERKYQSWVRERKNEILSWVNPQRKQKAWSQLFPEVTHDDSWMLLATVF